MKTQSTPLKNKFNLYSLYFPAISFMIISFLLSGNAPVIAQATGSATSSVTVTNATPTVGSQVIAAINIDVSGVNSPDNELGSFTGTLDWNPAVLSYNSNSGLPAGFTGAVNIAGISTGQITFNGANASGAAGNTIVLNITFNVISAGTSQLDLTYSAMAAASSTFPSLLGILVVNDGSVNAAPFSNPISYIGDLGSGTQTTAATLTTSITLSNSTSITAGDAIIIAYTTDAAPDIPITITNSWSATDKYQFASMGISTQKNRTYIFAAYNVSGLTAGPDNIITIRETLPTSGTQPQYRAAVASVFRGLAPVGALEQSSNGPANTTATSSTSPSSGSITTVQPIQLLIGAVGTQGSDVSSPGTWASGWTNGPVAGTTGETVSMAYQIVSTSGNYMASKTLTTARYWTAAIASFKSSATGISYIGDIGSNQSKTTGTSLDITTTDAIAAGEDIMVTFAADVATGTPTISDGVNTYNFISGADATSTGHVRTNIFAAYNVSALPSGSHIVITHPSITARAAVVSIFRGLSTSGALDQTNTGNSTSAGTSPSSGPTGSTSQSDELLIGAVGTEGGHYDAPGTWSNAFSSGPRLGTSVGTTSSAATDITASMGWKIVSATGAFTAAKGGIGSKPWAASIATFKGGADVTPPSVTINQASGQTDPTVISPINFTVVFSEPVTDFATGDVNFSGSTASGSLIGTVTGSGTTYNVAVTGMTSSGTIVANIASGVAHDAASNPNTVSTSADNTVTFNLDTTNPTVTINQAAGQADPAGLAPVNFTVVFSEPVTDFVTGDVDLSGSIASGTLVGTVTGSGTTYNVSVSGMTSSGTITASIAAGMAHDVSGNPNDVSTSADNTVTFNLDTTNPDVTINQASGQADATGDSPVNFTVVFSEPVTGFNTGDIALSGSALATTAEVTEISPNDGTTFNVAVSGMSASGNVMATVPAGVANDPTGNPNNVSTSTDNVVTFNYVAPPLGLDGTVSTGTGAANASSVTFSHTTGTGTKRLILVGVSWNSNTTSRTISSVTFTYGSNVLNLSEKIVQETLSTTKRFVAIWYSPTEPPQNTTGTVTVTFSGTVSNGIVAGAANFAGVNQTTPLGPSNGANSSSTGTALSVTLSSLNGNELVFDAAFIGASTPPDPVVDPSQARLWTATVSNTRGVASTKQATGASASMSWTTGTSAVVWACAAVAINPVSAGTSYNLTMALTPVSSGTTNPSIGIHNYDENTVVNITATPAAGYEFVNWTGDVADVNSPTTTVIINGDKTITANFTQLMYTLTTSTDGNGSVTLNPPGGSYVSGSQVILTPIPSIGYQFGSWTGANASEIVLADGDYKLLIDGNKAIYANFVHVEYSLTLISAHGTVNKNPDQPTYHEGDVVLLTPTPAAGWSFANWTGDLISSANPGSVTIHGNTSVTANYTQNEYTLTITSAHGTVNKNPDQPTYHEGDIVLLTPTPAAGWSFANWTGDLISSANPSSVTIHGNTSVTANYTQNEYTLTITSAHGTVNKNPDQPTYHEGDIVLLTATPAAGWSFASWTGDLISSANPGSVTIHGNTSVTANYTQNEYTMTITSVNGTVTSSPNQATYHEGDQVQLTAAPNEGWIFASWSGDLTGTVNPSYITIHGNTSVTANYSAENEYVLTVTSNHGTVSRNPNQATYHEGDQVQLTAAPVEGWSFANWTGDLISSVNPGSVTIHGNTSVTANYTQNEYTLTITSAHGTVNKNPDQPTYHEGDVVLLTPTPAAGWSFANWTGDLISSANPGSVTIHGNTSVTANYTQNEYTLTITSAHGTVNKNPDQPTYHEGDIVLLTPTPAEGWSFANWTGDLISSANPGSVTIHGNTSVTANYTQNEYTLMVNITGNGSVTKSPDKSTYFYGEAVQLTATPSAGWTFAEWGGDLTGLANPSSVTMDMNRTVTVTFSQTILTHEISLLNGWNIFSLYVTPENTDMLQVLKPLIDAGSLIKVQDELGRAVDFNPSTLSYINNIGNLYNTEGYKIKVNSATSLSITGIQVSLPVDIDLLSGWNIISYPVSNPGDAMQIMNTLIESGQLVKVQDEKGAAIEQLSGTSIWINNIGNFDPGKGYKVKVNGNSVLSINQNGSKSKGSIEINSADAATEFYKPVWSGNGLDQMNIYLSEITDGEPGLKPGDEIGIFDGLNCVGAGVIKEAGEKFYSFVVSADDPTTTETDGFVKGHSLSFRVWRPTKNTETSIEKFEYNSGSSKAFDPMGSAMISINTSVLSKNDYDITTSLGYNYPNPFVYETSIPFNVGAETAVDIAIYNIQGLKLRTLVHSTLQSGSYTTVWNITNEKNNTIMPGIYFCKMVAGNKVFVKTILIK